MHAAMSRPLLRLHARLPCLRVSVPTSSDASAPKGLQALLRRTKERKELKALRLKVLKELKACRHC
jgi:hypothetical protein